MEKIREGRDEQGKFVAGEYKGGPGRPKGKTLKEFAREMLMTMNDVEKRAYLKELPKEIVWRMSEGNPHNTNDVTSAGKPIPILGSLSSDAIQKNYSPGEDTKTPEAS